MVGLLLSAVRAGSQHRARAVLGRFCSRIAAGRPPWSCGNRTVHPDKSMGSRTRSCCNAVTLTSTYIPHARVCVGVFSYVEHLSTPRSKFSESSLWQPHAR